MLRSVGLNKLCLVSALYRASGPALLDDVVGQDHVKGPRRRALANDWVRRAYLFSGPRGCGKTSTALCRSASLYAVLERPFVMQSRAFGGDPVLPVRRVGPG